MTPFHYTYLPIYLITCLTTYLPGYLPGYLPTYMRAYAHTYLPTYLAIYSVGVGVSGSESKRDRRLCSPVSKIMFVSRFSLFFV